MRELLTHLADLLAGSRCTCGRRIYPRDLPLHLARNHSGDLT